MKTSEDVRIGAQLISSIQIDPATCFNWVKEEIQNIAYDHYKAAKYVKEKIVTTKKFETVILPDNLLMVDKLIFDRSGVGTTDFELHNGNELTISLPDTYEVRYYMKPDEPKTKTTEIDMPEQYINAMKYYVAARIRARLFGQADNNAVSFFQEYNTALDNADKSMSQLNRRHRRMPPSYRGL